MGGNNKNITGVACHLSEFLSQPAGIFSLISFSRFTPIHYKFNLNKCKSCMLYLLTISLMFSFGDIKKNKKSMSLKGNFHDKTYSPVTSGYFNQSYLQT